MEYLPVVAIVLISGGLTISLLRGGKIGMRWYMGNQSWNERDRQGTPVEPTDNVRSKQWG